MQGTTNSSSKGLHGGTVSTVKVILDVAADLNGIVYTCQAMNEVLQRSVHDAITLDVLCKCKRTVICLNLCSNCLTFFVNLLLFLSRQANF